MADVKIRSDVALLVVNYHQAVYKYAFRLTGSVHDAEDLTQEVFLAAQRKIDQLRNMGSAKAWLFAILRNRFIKLCQKRRPLCAADAPVDMDAISADPRGGEPDCDQLQEALNRLPDHYRLTVVMFYFEECSYLQIAKRLNVPIGTVMSRLDRAKKRLRVILREPGQPVGGQVTQLAGRAKVTP